MNTATITLLNFVVHSLVIGAAAWLLVRFVIRDAMRRCILANLAVLMCLYSPFDISMRDLFPPQHPVPVWTPLRETFEADWRVTVAPVTSSVVMPAVPVPTWDVNDLVKILRWLAWLVTAALLLRLLIQSIRVQRWAWRLRDLTQAEIDSLPKEVRFDRISVFDGDGTPCVAGWFFPVIAVPSAAFEKLTARQWRWLIRHESEHLRCHDTVAVLLQNIVRAFLWWNPFIHALIEEYARSREEACDAAAVGENRDQSDYADFLLAWAAKAVPQPSCVMPIAHSRPARRLKARLVALMEARGVRKKLGALFVLGCAGLRRSRALLCRLVRHYHGSRAGSGEAQGR
jgi:beta-lactamase regulating signal transducer with metallopeptidase domain